MEARAKLNCRKKELAKAEEEESENEHKYFDSVKGKWQKKYRKNGKLGRNFICTKDDMHLQEELVKLQYWVRRKGLKVAILFEGRDAAGKGGVIKRITETNQSTRVIRVVALGVPTEREKTQWYFQRLDLPFARSRGDGAF